MRIVLEKEKRVPSGDLKCLSREEKKIVVKIIRQARRSKTIRTS